MRALLLLALTSCVIVHVHEAPRSAVTDESGATYTPGQGDFRGSWTPKSDGIGSGVVECDGVNYLDGHTDCTPVTTAPAADPCSTLSFATSSSEDCTRCPSLCAVTTAPFGNTEADFYVNHVLSASITTNIPTGTARVSGTLFELLKNTGTTNRDVKIDYWAHGVDLNSPRSP